MFTIIVILLFFIVIIIHDLCVCHPSFDQVGWSLILIDPVATRLRAPRQERGAQQCRIQRHGQG